MDHRKDASGYVATDRLSPQDIVGQANDERMMGKVSGMPPNFAQDTAAPPTVGYPNTKPTNTRPDVFGVIKKYDHNLGLSVSFRQWRAQSHCRFLHGYAIAVELGFQATALDENGWVIDYGSLAGIKRFLEVNFDHKTVIAKDDPALAWFEEGQRLGALELVVMERVGCEMFAKMVGEYVMRWLSAQHGSRVALTYCKIIEHNANSAVFQPGAPV